MHNNECHGRNFYQWELRELRTGGTQKDQADQNGGSVLCGTESQVDNVESAVKEQLTKLGIDLVKAVERGVDPDQSLIFKRKKEQQGPQSSSATPMTPSAGAPPAGTPPAGVPPTGAPWAKRVKYWDPATGVEYEGTVEERQNAMKMWMGQISHGSPGPAFEFPAGYGFHRSPP